MYYAVKNGRKTGIFESWEECSAQIKGFSGALFKKFKNYNDALLFMENSKTVDNVVEDLKGLHAYIDGSFSQTKQETGYGVVIILDEEVIHTIKGSSKKYVEMRNVAGELFAASIAVKWAVDKGYKEITLHHDYSGIAAWAENKWKTKQEGTINYKNYMDSLKDKIKVNFIKVKGHSGDKYNDMADKLAKEGIDINI